ncbi:response regulator transcription factor [Longimicrobium sp.]|uniref:response regulator transcription factor n=1 Tax=Longimicrobium sp. TaxID=2029185 RepID=UPI002E32E793|nr:response regulator transcription factor [Longimicrobium sp.]HEX6042503.1 response regulator transcription factor [Longimicrobium sp.]
MRILVVEDNPRIAAFLQKGLREEGYVVEVAGDGDQAYEKATTQGFDAAIVDVMIPGRSGVQLVSDLREREVRLPVLLLTARDRTEDKVAGLDAGADDYLTKPFEFSELTARLRALLRRLGSPGGAATLKAGDVEMDPATREVRRGQAAVELTPREYALLEYLLRNSGRPLSRAAIMEHVWGIRFDPGTNIVDVCINSLRTKLDDRERGLIQTVRGVGYAIKPPAGEETEA